MRLRRVCSIAFACLALAVGFWFWWPERAPAVPAGTMGGAGGEPSALEASLAPPATRLVVPPGAGASAAAAAHVEPPPIGVTVCWQDDATPVSGLTLVVTDAVRPYPVRGTQAATTDAHGRAELRLSAGTHVVMVTSECCKAVVVGEGQPTEHELRLPGGARVHGRVVDEDDVPIAGARVALARGSLLSDATLGVTAADGTFTARLPTTLGFVFAEKRGHGRSQAVQVAGLLPTEPAVDLVLAPATTTVRGVVVDAAGRPVAGARVTVGTSAPPLRQPGYSEPVPPPVLRTSADGAFACDDVPPGDGAVLASAAGFAPAAQPFVASLGQVTEVRITLQRGARVEGLVRDGAGQPVPGARIVRGAHGQPEVVENDGTFGLDVAPGEVELRAERADLGVDAVRVAVVAGETRRVEFALRPGLVLAGRVVDERGAPRAGLWVSALEHAPLPVTVTDVDGRYRIVGCVAGRARVEVRTDAPFAGLPLASVEAEPGAPVPDLVVPAADASLRLRVVRLDDELPCQLELRAEGSEAGVLRMLPPSGEVCFAGLVAGRYYVRHAYLCDPPRVVYGLDLGPVDLGAGDTRDLGTHTLATPNALDLQVCRRDGVPVRSARVMLRALGSDERPFRAFFDQHGRLYPRSFPPGRYRVVVEAGLDHDGGEAEVEIAAARTTPLRIEVDR
ncbi:MAG: carboxypeptidase-like regulatory domain-containing protein [Planctomycetota bacterium]